MPRRRFEDARCLVTGASMGLGRALVESLVARGARVVFAARSADKLREVADSLIASGARPEAVLPFPADVTLAEDRADLLEYAAEQFGGALDLAINNAGIGAYGRFESHDETVARRVFEINVFALIEMSRGVLPLLRQGKSPALCNIGSIVARRGLPGRSEYSASKFAVAGFTEAIRAEWARDNIDVLLMNPGFTATEFEKNLAVDTAVYKTQGRRTMTAEKVAEATLKALEKGKKEVTLSSPGRLLLLANRLSPRFVNWALGRWTKKLYADAEALARVEPKNTDRLSGPPQAS
jgi:short-subunit dehydrogenase